VSERFIRCAHCGLPHDAQLRVCPTTGLRIEAPQHAASRRRSAGREQRDREDEKRRLIGRVVDRKYLVRGVIGEGGMSTIYEAEHVGLDRMVAMKVLHPSLADDPEAIARLKQEARVVSAIGNPNICAVFDMGKTDDGSPYLVMERLVGESLAERIKNQGAMSFGELAPLMRQILAALEAAHQKGILHRDLKPENVFIEEPRALGRATAKLLDFGISKSMTYEMIEDYRLTHTGMVMGTPYYMAPEQARGDSGLDQRVDLWAVGVIMYEALTGRRPFVATNYNALLVKILTSRPRPVQKIAPHIPDKVAALVDKALSKLREDRFQSAREFGEAIARLERELGAEDPYTPTMMLRRQALRPPAAGERSDTSAHRAAHRDWAAAIDDPPTFVDDDLSPNPVGPSRAAPGRAAAPASWDGYDEPVEPTIQDRAASDPDEWDTAGTDTEVMQRQLEGRRPPPSGGGTEVMDRDDLMRRHGARRGEMQHGKGAAPPARPAIPDDEEKTTLYDIEAARARLRARQEERAREEQAGGQRPPPDGRKRRE
jgi:serine/threonine protein kinase